MLPFTATIKGRLGLLQIKASACCVCVFHGTTYLGHICCIYIIILLLMVLFYLFIQYYAVLKEIVYICISLVLPLPGGLNQLYQLYFTVKYLT